MVFHLSFVSFLTSSGPTRLRSGARELARRRQYDSTAAESMACASTSTADHVPFVRRLHAPKRIGPRRADSRPCCGLARTIRRVVRRVRAPKASSTAKEPTNRSLPPRSSVCDALVARKVETARGEVRPRRGRETNHVEAILDAPRRRSACRSRRIPDVPGVTSDRCRGGGLPPRPRAMPAEDRFRFAGDPRRHRVEGGGRGPRTGIFLPSQNSELGLDPLFTGIYHPGVTPPKLSLCRPALGPGRIDSEPSS